MEVMRTGRKWIVEGEGDGWVFQKTFPTKWKAKVAAKVFEAGVWQKVHEVLLATLQGAAQIDWSRAVVDSASVRALVGGRKRGRIRRVDGNWGVSTT